MQHPNYKLYKFLEDDIRDIIDSYIRQFVETNKQLMDKKGKIRFLSPPVDFSKLHQGEQVLNEYESILEAYERYDKLKVFRVQCFMDSVENTDSLSIDFMPMAISHIVLEPFCTANVSKLKVDTEDYRDHLLECQVAEVSYCVGKRFKGFIRGIYILGKIFSNRKLEKLLNKSNRKNGRPTFSGFLKQFNDILDDEECSMIKEVEDHPESLRGYLREWDTRLIDTIGSQQIQTALSAADLNLKNWLTE